MPHIQANNITIYYEQDGSGPAMVWAHGLMGSLHGWDETSDYFRGRFQVIAYDGRGHGRSEKPVNPEAYSQDIMMEDMKGLLDSLNIEKAVVGGHSMGSNIALNFALKYPERCLGLIPVGIGTGSSDQQWWKDYFANLADVAEKHGMRAVLEEVKKVPAWAPALQNPELGPLVGQELLSNCSQAIANTIRGVVRARPSIFQLEPKLIKCPVPTLVVCSDADKPVIECSRFMVEKMPHAQMVEVSAKSHWTHMESPDRFLQVVDDFVSKLI